MRPMTAAEIREVPAPTSQEPLEHAYASILSWQLLGRNSVDLIWGPLVRKGRELEDIEREAPGLYGSLVSGGFDLEWKYRFTLDDGVERYSLRISW